MPGNEILVRLCPPLEIIQLKTRRKLSWPHGIKDNQGER